MSTDRINRLSKGKTQIRASGAERVPRMTKFHYAAEIEGLHSVNRKP